MQRRNPRFMILRSERLFRGKKAKESAALRTREMAYMRECSRQGIRTPCPQSKIAHRRAYSYDYKGIMTQKPTLKFTHTSVPSPKGVPEPRQQPKIVRRRAYFHYREVV